MIVICELDEGTRELRGSHCGLDSRSKVFRRDLFEEPSINTACIVDEHVDPPELVGGDSPARATHVNQAIVSHPKRRDRTPDGFASSRFIVYARWLEHQRFPSP